MIAKKTTKKRGRPPSPEPLRARTIRVSDRDWEAFHGAATANGGNLNAWIRRVLTRAAKRR